MNKRLDLSNIWVRLAIIVTLCCLGYSNSLTNQFMLDDYLVLFGEMGVAHMSLTDIFTQSQGAFYRPVGHVILWICYHLFGANPVGYHAVNLLLLAGISLVFDRCVFRLTGNSKLALLTACLYAVHPIQSMLVNYITASVISSFVLTAQGSWWMFLKYLDDARPRYYGLALILLVMSLLCHEMAIVLPIVFWATLFFVKRVRLPEQIRLTFMPALIVAGFYVFRMKFFALEKSTSTLANASADWMEYLGAIAHLISWYLQKLVIPLDIIFLWTANLERGPFVIDMLICLALIAAGLILLFKIWQPGIRSFALTCFVVGLAPVAIASYTYMPFTDPIIEPHWFYFTSIGFFILAATLLIDLKNLVGKRLWIGLLAAVMIFNMVALRGNNARWTDEETYCRYWLSLNTGNLTPYFGLGRTLNQQQRYSEALQVLEQGMQSSRYHNVMILAEIGYAYLQNNQPDQALDYIRQALQMDFNYSVTHYYLGLYYERLREYDKARQAINKAILLFKHDPRYHQALERLDPGRS